MMQVGDRYYSVTATGARGLWTMEVISVVDVIAVEMRFPIPSAIGAEIYRKRHVKFPLETTDADLIGWRKETTDA